VFFFDEAHLLFDDAPPALVQRIEQVVRLIRSKGVGVYFCSQFPDDVPDNILGQLGNRVQHALRAFTPRDQKAVRTAAETFVPNPKLDVAKAITTLGTGEALVSTLQDKGVPSPVEQTLIAPPRCRMGAITDAERAQPRRQPGGRHYDQPIDRESAAEMLTRRAGAAVQQSGAPATPASPAPAEAQPTRRPRPGNEGPAAAPSAARPAGNHGQADHAHGGQQARQPDRARHPRRHLRRQALGRRCSTIVRQRNARQARACGIDRLEAVASIEVGGLTPDETVLRGILAAGVPTMVMLRPHARSFVYDEADMRAVFDAIAMARKLARTGWCSARSPRNTASTPCVWNRCSMPPAACHSPSTAPSTKLPTCARPCIARPLPQRRGAGAHVRRTCHRARRSGVARAGPCRRHRAAGRRGVDAHSIGPLHARVQARQYHAGRGLRRGQRYDAPLDPDAVARIRTALAYPPPGLSG
jgi:hypothetical protein